MNEKFWLSFKADAFPYVLNILLFEKTVVELAQCSATSLDPLPAVGLSTNSTTVLSYY